MDSLAATDSPGDPHKSHPTPSKPLLSDPGPAAATATPVAGGKCLGSGSGKKKRSGGKHGGKNGGGRTTSNGHTSEEEVMVVTTTLGGSAACPADGVEKSSQAMADNTDLLSDVAIRVDGASSEPPLESNSDSDANGTRPPSSSIRFIDDKTASPSLDAGSRPSGGVFQAGSVGSPSSCFELPGDFDGKQATIDPDATTITTPFSDDYSIPPTSLGDESLSRDAASPLVPDTNVPTKPTTAASVLSASVPQPSAIQPPSGDSLSPETLARPSVLSVSPDPGIANTETVTTTDTEAGAPNPLRRWFVEKEGGGDTMPSSSSSVGSPLQIPSSDIGEHTSGDVIIDGAGDHATSPNGQIVSPDPGSQELPDSEPEQLVRLISQATKSELFGDLDSVDIGAIADPHASNQPISEENDDVLDDVTVNQPEIPGDDGDGNNDDSSDRKPSEPSGVRPSGSGSDRSNSASVERNAAVTAHGPKLSNGLEQKRKKREARTVDNLLKELADITSPEEKLAAVCAKYAEMVEENKTAQKTLKQTQKIYTTLTKEKDHWQLEHNKQMLARTKLESLCRELQKANKTIKEESWQEIKVQEDKRKEVSVKFHTALVELSNSMAAGKDRSNQLHTENTNLAAKLQSLIEQCDAKDEHTKKVLSTRELEIKLLEAKFSQAQLQLKHMEESNLKEKQELLVLLHEKEKQLLTLMHTEKQLKEQLAAYANKYEDFQSSLEESNNVFKTFKSEMDKMTKRLKRMDQETTEWKQKWAKSNNALVESVKEKTAIEKQASTVAKKNKALEKLCRELQEDRKKVTSSPANPKKRNEKTKLVESNSVKSSLNPKHDENCNLITSPVESQPVLNGHAEKVEPDNNSSVQPPDQIPLTDQSQDTKSNNDSVPIKPDTSCPSPAATPSTPLHIDNQSDLAVSDSSTNHKPVQSDSTPPLIGENQSNSPPPIDSVNDPSIIVSGSQSAIANDVPTAGAVSPSVSTSSSSEIVSSQSDSTTITSAVNQKQSTAVSNDTTEDELGSSSPATTKKSNVVFSNFTGGGAPGLNPNGQSGAAPAGSSQFVDAPDPGMGGIVLKQSVQSASSSTAHGESTDDGSKTANGKEGVEQDEDSDEDLPPLMSDSPSPRPTPPPADGVCGSSTEVKSDPLPPPPSTTTSTAAGRNANGAPEMACMDDDDDDDEPPDLIDSD